MKKNLSLLFLISVFFMGCTSETVPVPCGCDADIAEQLTEEGSYSIFYNKPENEEDTFYTGYFWIEYNHPNDWLTSYMIVCNEDILGAEFQALKDMPAGERMNVSITGLKKPLCDVEEESVYHLVKLTSIEKL